jgi:hypothetical protein
LGDLSVLFMQKVRKDLDVPLRATSLSSGVISNSGVVKEAFFETPVKIAFLSGEPAGREEARRIREERS